VKQRTADAGRAAKGPARRLQHKCEKEKEHERKKRQVEKKDQENQNYPMRGTSVYANYVGLLGKERDFCRKYSANFNIKVI
jgi:hypothetical protein